MAYYALLYEVVDDYLTRRGEFRDEHLKLAREAHARGEVLLAGAWAEPADGALIIFCAPNKSTPENFAQQDPYVRNGLVKHWKVRPWNVVVGDGATAAKPK